MTHEERLRERMVDLLLKKGSVRTPAIEAAFRTVPRHEFLPGVAPEEAYRDQHVTTKEEAGQRLSSSTAPWLMAGMLEQLQPQPGQRILEIGAGTGYNAAILAHLLGPRGQVVTLDIDDEVVEGARRALDRLGWTATSTPSGCAPIEARCADGFAGHALGAPWDGILVTVRTTRVAESWRDQLSPQGRLVVPLALGGVRHGQLSIAFEPAGDHLRSLSLIDCGFIRPRGGMVMEDREIQLAEQPGLRWSDGARHPVPAAQLFEMLEGPKSTHPTGLLITTSELIESFQPWLVVHDPDTCSVMAEESFARWDRFLPMIEIPGRLRGAGGIFDGRGIALLGFGEPPRVEPPRVEPPSAQPRELFITSYGYGGAASRLCSQVYAWDRDARPGRSRMRLRLFTPGQAPPETARTGVLTRESWADLAIDWPPAAS